ncbi:MAG: hypothetical protein DRR19_01160 [Candidatus Parabeggiatoa sp. nov. 1]|nr:MAG: hypothetical protein DRR19_01160 [Gammaproteobacteria bacterium]
MVFPKIGFLFKILKTPSKNFSSNINWKKSGKRRAQKTKGLFFTAIFIDDKNFYLKVFLEKL